VKKYICITGIFVFIVLLLTSCTPVAVEELNQSFSNVGLRITATDMSFEPCQSGDGNLIVYTYFLLENNTKRRTIPVWIESDFLFHFGRETFYLEDIPPGESVEFNVTMVVPSDASNVWYGFYTREDAGPLAHFWLSLDLARPKERILVPIEELNQSASFDGRRITATDLRVEPCPLDDDYLIVTPYFLIENISNRRTVEIWIRNQDQSAIFHYIFHPGESGVLDWPYIVPRGTHEVWYEFFNNADADVVLTRFQLSLDLAR